MFQPVQSGILCIRCGQCTPERYGEGSKNARNGGMHTGQQGRVPQQGRQYQIGPQRIHLEPVERQHRQPQDEGGQKCRQIQLGGIEKRNDRHCAHIVDNRHGREKQFERSRCPAAQKGKHANGKGDICRGRYRPTAHELRVASRKAEIDCRWDNHAGCGRDNGKSSIRPGCQMPVDKFTFDFQADEQEENRHQSVIDPQMDRHRAQLGRQLRADNRMDEMEILRGKGRIGNKHRQRRRHHQQYPACRFAGEKLAQG